MCICKCAWFSFHTHSALFFVSVSLFCPGLLSSYLILALHHPRIWCSLSLLLSLCPSPHKCSFLTFLHTMSTPRNAPLILLPLVINVCCCPVRPHSFSICHPCFFVRHFIHGCVGDGWYVHFQRLSYQEQTWLLTCLAFCDLTLTPSSFSFSSVPSFCPFKMFGSAPVSLPSLAPSFSFYILSCFVKPWWMTSSLSFSYVYSIFRGFISLSQFPSCFPPFFLLPVSFLLCFYGLFSYLLLSHLLFSFFQCQAVMGDEFTFRDLATKRRNSQWMAEHCICDIPITAEDRERLRIGYVLAPVNIVFPQ